MGFLTNIGNDLSNLWNQGSSAVQNDIVKPIQQAIAPVEQSVGHAVAQIPQEAINFGNLASSFAQHLPQVTASQAPQIPQFGQSMQNAVNAYRPAPAPNLGQIAPLNFNSPTNGASANMPAQTALQSRTGPGAQITAGLQLQNAPGTSAPQGNKIHSKTQSGGSFNSNPFYDSGLAVGAVASLATEGEGAGGKIGQDVIDKATQVFTHNLGALTGDVTKTFKPQEIETAIQQLKGQPLSGDAYKDAAVRLANFIDAAKSGVLTNAPAGVGLVTKNIRGTATAPSSVGKIIAKGTPLTKTIGQLQEATQIPDLTAYEKAFNAGDTKTLDQLAAAHPGDARFQVHQNLPPAIPAGQQERKFITSVKESPEVSPQVQGAVSGSYKIKPNQVLTDTSSKLINGKGLDQATNQVLGDLAKKGNIADQTVSDAIAVAKAHDEAGNFDQATNIYNQLAPKLTEAGRSVQAASLLDNRTPQGLLYSAVKTLKGAKVDVTPEVNASLEGLINGIKQTAEGSPERNIATQKLVQFVNQSIPRSKVDAALGIWRAGLLTGPETVAKVAVSHGVTTPIEMAAQIPAELADRMMSLVTGKRSLTATTQGFGSGLVSGAKSALFKIKSGLDTPGSGGFESDFGSHTTQTPYENFVGNVHGSLSKPTFTARYNVSLNDQALTEATNQGLKGAQKDSFVKDFVANPTTEVKSIATKDAQVATNQEVTTPGKAATATQKALGPFGKVLMPFTRIPSAIGVNGIVNYTPFGISQQVVKAIASGNFDQRVMAQAFGRSATGTTVAALGALLAAHGMMTLKAPQDPKERALWDMQGKQPNSIKMGNTWVSLNAFGPVGIVLGLGGGFGEGLKQNNGDALKASEQALASGGGVLLDQPYLKGISGMTNALNDPTRYGQTFFNNTAGSVIPAISSQIARGTDTVQRMYPKDIAGKFASEIPGLEEGQPVQRDLFGNPLSGANPSGTIPGGVAGTINPFYPSQGHENVVTDELQRLYDSQGSSGAPNISQPSAAQTINGQKVKLNNQQVSNFIAQEGPQVQKALNDLIQNPSYQALNDTDRSNLISQAIGAVKNNNTLKSSVLTPEQLNGSTQVLAASTQKGVPAATTTSGKKGALTSVQLKTAEDAFANSSNNVQDLGSVVLRKDAAGNVTAMTKDAWNTAIYEKQLTNAKTAKDYGTYQQVGNNLLSLYQKQLQDPNVDDLDKLTIQSKMTSLESAIGKAGSAGSKSKVKISIPNVSAAAITPLSTGSKSVITMPKATTIGTSKMPNFRIVSGSKPMTNKTSAFKITKPRIMLSKSGASQRGVRKAANVSVPTRHRVAPVLTV